MFSRLAWNFVMFASLATLAGVGYFFFTEYRQLQLRQATVIELKALARDEGPCAAMLMATQLHRDAEGDFDLRRNIDVLRRAFAIEILNDMQDKRGQAALVSAADDGLLSSMLCEQIKMSQDLGEAHPVMALLRFTKERDPCEEALNLRQVISGLGSHRALLLRGLMEDVERLRCLTPAMSHEVAMQVAAMLHDDPQAFDDLNVLRIASFLTTWAPMQAAQVGCRIEAFGDVSRLGNTLSCSPDQRGRVLARYRYNRPIPPGPEGTPGLPTGSEVVVIWRSGNRCELRPNLGPPRIVTGACDDLEMVSNLEIAVLIERIEYGLARADLISGLAHYAGGTKVTEASTTEPQLRSWFAYNRTGQALGTTQVTNLEEMAELANEELPESPLRTFCHSAGAKYCYDVDWTQLVQRIPNPAVVYLSLPLDVFLPEAVLPKDAANRIFAEAFGDAPRPDVIPRIYRISDDSNLVAEVKPNGVNVRWRIAGDTGWRGQSFGIEEGGAVPPAARLVAAMDLQGDGRPELILQRAERRDVGGELRDATDEIRLVHLDGTGSKFVTLTELTVHEY